MFTRNTEFKCCYETAFMGRQTERAELSSFALNLNKNQSASLSLTESASIDSLPPKRSWWCCRTAFFFFDHH